MTAENISRTRRNNFLIIIREFSESELASGQSSVGMMGRLAEKLQMKASALSQIKGDETARSFRNIGDAQAAQIEKLSGKPKGWMDQAHEGADLNPAEIAFLELAKQAWRGADAKGRRALMKAAKQGFPSLPSA